MLQEYISYFYFAPIFTNCNQPSIRTFDFSNYLNVRNVLSSQHTPTYVNFCQMCNSVKSDFLSWRPYILATLKLAMRETIKHSRSSSKYSDWKIDEIKNLTFRILLFFWFIPVRDRLIHRDVCVTVWPDGLNVYSVFCHLQQWKFAQLHVKFAKISSK